MKTVSLILGAGASAPYGFPLGAELKQKSVEMLQDNSKLYELKIDKDVQMMALRKSLIEILSNDPSVQTIDSFLARNPKYTELMRIIVTEIILKYEMEHQSRRFLQNVDRKDPALKDWYSWLFNEYFYLSEKPKNKFYLNVLTYNYDRSFEFYFIRALMSQYGMSGNIAAEFFYNNVNVLHMNGTLSRLAEYEDYGKTKGQKISFLHEIKDGFHSTELIENALEDCDITVFLGFGYDEKNVYRLRPNEYLVNRDVFGTAFGIPEQEVSGLNSDWNWNVIFGGRTQGSYEFLDEVVGSRRFR
jgi:hypothetical protein